MATPSHNSTSDLAKAIVEEMKAHGHALWLDPEIHADQHEFIAQMIEERKERTARRRRLEEKIAGSVVLSMLAMIVTLLGLGVMEWFRKRT